MRVAFIVSLFLALGGCLQAEPAASEPETDSGALADYVAQQPDGARALSDLKEFVELAPRRYDNQFQHDAARDWLHAALEETGLQVERQTFVGAAQAGDDVEGQNIVATIPGGDRIILVGAHYDSAVSAQGAAYDDGTGTMLMVELARAAATRDWNHTLMFVAFDQEEAGLVGSAASANAFVEQGAQVFMINYDMVGINWPAKIGGAQDRPLDAFFGGENEDALAAMWQEAIAAAGYPDEASTQQTGLGSGSSDHGPFRAADFPALWVRGALIGSYPAYHNLDTVESMTAAVGGDEAALEAGFEAAMGMTLAFMSELDRSAQSN